jgi:predicted transcriptional regulator
MPSSAEPTALPSDAQWEVMNVVWDRGEATVGEAWRILSARRPVARNTVLTLMARLEEKGWLRRLSGGAPLRYTATIPRQKALRRMARRLIMAILGDGGLSEGEAQRIRAMLDSARQEKKGRDKS